MIYQDVDYNFPIDVVANNTIYDEVCHFVSSIRNGENMKNPGTVGAGNTSVLDSLKASLKLGKVVQVNI